MKLGNGIEDVVARLTPLLDDANAEAALKVLEADFAEVDSLGPRRVADFIHGDVHEDLQADVRGLVLDLAQRCRSSWKPKR